MNIKSWFRPFEKVAHKERLVIIVIWLVLVFGYWFLSSMGQKHLFPTPSMVWDGLKALFNEGLVVHIGSSLALCLQATVISIVITLIIAYLSPLPFLKPLAQGLSKVRYLPLTGITFYLTIMISNARTMQVSVLVVFMTLYFITSMLSVLKDIPNEEIDHARSLRCSRWEVLWEVVIKGRLD